MGLSDETDSLSYKEISCGQPNPRQSDAGGGTGISFVCVSLCHTSDPYEDDGPAETDSGSGRNCGEEISQYAYSAWLWEGKRGQMDESRDELAPDGMKDIFGFAAQAGIEAMVLGRIDKKWVRDVSFMRTAIENDMVHIVMTYRMPLPFSVFRIDSIKAEAVCVRRLWIGAEGNRKGNLLPGEDEMEEMVYVGRNSTRYHRNRNCHYLFNDLKQVQAGEMDGLRNQEGKRYYPCPSCKAADSKGPFIMPWGTRYHSTGQCGAIRAYVQTVPLSEVEHLGECSYCGRGSK
mgnify:CR=1 FL=1